MTFSIASLRGMRNATEAYDGEVNADPGLRPSAIVQPRPAGQAQIL